MTTRSRRRRSPRRRRLDAGRRCPQPCAPSRARRSPGRPGPRREIMPASSQPRPRCPCTVAIASRLDAEWTPRPSARRRSSSSTARASSNRSIIAWESEPREMATPASARRRSARCRRRGPVRWSGTGTRSSPSPRSVDVVVGQVGGVDGGEPRCRGHRRRRAGRSACAVVGQRTVRSRPAARRRGHGAGIARVRPFGDDLHRLGVDGPHRVDGSADRLGRRAVTADRPVRPRPRPITIGKAALSAVGRRSRRPQAAVEVEVSSSVMRSPASAAAASSASPIAFGSGVGRAVGLVVDVVELADDRDAGHRHLGEGGPGQAVVAVGVEPSAARYMSSRHVQNDPLTGLGPTPQRSMEGVAVCVGQAREWSDPRSRIASGGAGDGGRRSTEPAVSRPMSTTSGPTSIIERAPAHTSTWSGHDPTALDERGDPLDERVAVVLFELVPGGERGRVGRPGR